LTETLEAEKKYREDMDRKRTISYLLFWQSITVTGIFAVNNDGNTALHYLVRMHPKEKDVEQYLRVLRQIVDKVKKERKKQRVSDCV
jgi:hypothetical protein